MRSLTVRQWCGGWSRGWSRGRGGAAAAAADEEDEDEGRVGLLQLNTYTLLPRAAFKDRSYTPASEGVKKNRSRSVQVNQEKTALCGRRCRNPSDQ